MRTAEYENMAANDSSHWYFKGMQHIMLSLLRASVGTRNDLRILDAGSGTCWFTHTLGEFGTVIALDISEEALSICRRRGVERLIKADVAKVPFPDGSFDLIVCSEVLYHQMVPDDAAVAAEFGRLLAPNGLVLIKVPAHQYLWGAHDDENLTRRRYEPADLRGILMDAGFMIERMTFAGFFLFPAVYIKRRLGDKSRPASDIQSTNIVLNSILLWVLLFEAMLVRFIRLPQGSSLIALARRKG